MKFKRRFRGLSLKPNPHFIVKLVNALAIVMVWRGMWNLLDVYFFPQHKVISDIICIAVGLALLYLPDGELEL
jgi:hypothetical protein